MRSRHILLLAVIAGQAVAADPSRPHNAIIFVADGLRGAIVDAQTAPNLDALRREGVAFPNSHSLYPTVTTANASAIATGHYLGDTGNFANTLFVGFPAQFANGESTPTPFLEEDFVIGDIDAHFAGNYHTETSLLAAARAKGFSTAALGKVGPTLIQDHTDRSGQATIFFDDKSGLVNERTGNAEGLALSAEVKTALEAAGLAATLPASDKPNLAQQQYLVDVASKVVLPLFKQRRKPFVLVFWARDPDFSQHYQLDSRYSMLPGINGSTSLAAIRNTDSSLGQIRAALKALKLDADTDLFVTSDHGFSTISKQSDTSHSVKCDYDNLPAGFLPPGFLSLDISNALDLPLFDPDANNAEIDRQANCELGAAPAKPGAVVKPKRTRNGSGLIGRDREHPDIVVAAGAGSALLYLTSASGKLYVQALINFLLSQDYVGGLLVDDSLGRFPGTIPSSAINLVGNARTPHPSIFVSFRSFSTGCEQPLRCGAEVSDSALQQGQGMHGAFSRADTFNFMAAVGPSFKRRYSNPAPVGNADIVPTLAQVLGIEISAQGKLVGRVIGEALNGGKPASFVARACTYPAAQLGRGAAQDQPPLTLLQPVLRVQTVGATRYFDAAGLIGRTLGLDPNTDGPCEIVP
jgi:arylsulfatase A-like enzyme